MCFDHDPACSVCGHEHYPWCRGTKPKKEKKPKRKTESSPEIKRAVKEFLGPTLGDHLDSTIGEKHGIFDEQFDDDY